MASIKGFLTNYFKQLHFNAMTPEVRARWEEYLKLPDLNNSMKDWRSQLMHETAPGSKEYVNNDLPDILTELTNDQITELYKQINDVISGMAEDKKLNAAEYAAAKKFIEDFYGDTKVFHIIKVSGPTDIELKKLVTSGLLNKLKQPIEDAIRYVGGEKKPSFRDITDGITSGKYDKDSTFRSQLIDIFERVESAASWTWAQRPENQQALNDFINVRDNLIKGLQPDPTVADVERFKRNLKRDDDDKNVLRRLYKKSKAKELFANHDSYGLAGALDDAKSEVDYDKTDSENYLYPKTEKHLNFPQTIKDKWDKFYENRLEKWRNLGGDYMFQSRAAEDIVKAIKKEKIKPTDGLDAVLNNAEKIKGDMAHTGIQTGKHFEWFLKEMKIVKEADKDAFNACLFSGISLRQVVQRIAMDAVKSGKIAEAETALEILSAVKYENTTSKIVDNLEAHFKENSQGILNNKDLSWNKSEGVQFVTNALTKTLRVGVIVVAKIATIAVNTVRKSGSKINKENDDLKAAHDAWKKDVANQKAALGTAIADSTARETKAKTKLGIITTKFGSGATIATAVATSTTNRETMLADATLKMNLKKVQDFIDMGIGTPAEISAAQAFLENYKEYVDGLKDSITVPPVLTTTSISTSASDILTYVTDPAFKAVIAKWKDARKVQRGFDYATNQLKVATDELKANEDEMAHWDENHKDRYDELIKYWNKLEYGRDMHLGRMLGGHYSRFGSKKNQQALHYQMFNNGMTRAA